VPEWQLHLCYSHDFLGQWEQAIEWCNKAAANNVAHGYPLAALAAAYSWAGHDKEAKDVVAQLLDADPNFTVQIFQHRVSDDPTSFPKWIALSPACARLACPMDR
jgi:tetratricopeptide (TPR) repeat protein